MKLPLSFANVSVWKALNSLLHVCLMVWKIQLVSISILSQKRIHIDIFVMLITNMFHQLGIGEVTFKFKCTLVVLKQKESKKNIES